MQKSGIYAKLIVDVSDSKHDLFTQVQSDKRHVASQTIAARKQKLKYNLMSEQERQRFIASGHLISISQAAEHTPYSQEYLSLLARRGKLKAVKIARNWVTTREAVLLYILEQEDKHREIMKSLAIARKDSI